MLAFVGMLIGLVLGNLENFSSWMFAATAGTLRNFTSIFSIFPEEKRIFDHYCSNISGVCFSESPLPCEKK